jgi:hypothetical protein
LRRTKAVTVIGAVGCVDSTRRRSSERASGCGQMGGGGRGQIEPSVDRFRFPTTRPHPSPVVHTIFPSCGSTCAQGRAAPTSLRRATAPGSSRCGRYRDHRGRSRERPIPLHSAEKRGTTRQFRAHHYRPSCTDGLGWVRESERCRVLEAVWSNAVPGGGLLTSALFDPEGQFLHLVVDPAPFGHFLPDLLVRVHHRGVVAATECLPDFRQ